MDLLKPRALNPRKARGTGGNNPWAAEQTAMGDKSNSLQIQTKDMSKGARRRDRADTWGNQTRERGYGMESRKETDPGESP